MKKTYSSWQKSIYAQIGECGRPYQSNTTPTMTDKDIKVQLEINNDMPRPSSVDSLGLIRVDADGKPYATAQELYYELRGIR